MAARAEFAPLVKDNTANVPTKSGGSYKYTYADLHSLLDLALPVMRSHGLHIFQAGDFDGSLFCLTTVVAHTSGAWLSNVFRMPCAAKDAQAVGSAETYARRYALMALLTVAAEDDDGAGAMPTQAQKPVEKPQPSKAPALGEWGTKVAGLFDNEIRCPKDKRADLIDAATCGEFAMADVKNEKRAQVLYGILENVSKSIPYAEMASRIQDVRALGTDSTLGDAFDSSFGV
jgi:hypothetical protein